jgi:hypothetical protein
VRGGSGICNGRRERVPGGPFPFSIAVCFLHPVIVGNEVGNTDRSSSFYLLLNAGTAGTRAPVTFFAFTFRIASFIYTRRRGGIAIADLFSFRNIVRLLANSCVRVILNFLFFFPARLPNDSFAKRHKRSSSAGDIISSNFSFFGFFFPRLQMKSKVISSLRGPTDQMVITLCTT